MQVSGIDLVFCVVWYLDLFLELLDLLDGPLQEVVIVTLLLTLQLGLLHTTTPHRKTGQGGEASIHLDRGVPIAGTAQAHLSRYQLSSVSMGGTCSLALCDASFSSLSSKPFHSATYMGPHTHRDTIEWSGIGKGGGTAQRLIWWKPLCGEWVCVVPPCPRTLGCS